MDEQNRTWPTGVGEMARRVRDYDWAATPLGLPGTWPPSVRVVVEMMLASPLLSSVAIGNERRLVYNDAAARFYGDRHPAALGQPLAATFPESFPNVAALYDRVFAGETVTVTAQPLDMRDDGRGEMFDAYLTPVRGADGAVVAAHMTGFEVGERLRGEMKMRESEERLRGVLDGMGEGFGVIGPDFTILEYNREALRMDGRPKAQIVGQSHWDAFPGTEHSEVGLLLKRAMADRQSAFLEHLYAWEEGRALWLELRVYPLADGALAVFWRDVTARKTAEAALTESEARFAQFAASTTDVLWIRDADTLTLEYISPAFEPVFGVTTGDVDGGIEPGAALVDPTDRERVMEHLDAARRGEPQVYEFRIVHGSDGGPRWIRDHCFPLIDGAGRVERIGGIARDVTEFKLADQALRESEERQRMMVELVPALLWSASPDGGEVSLNERWLTYTGQSEAETQNYGWLEAIHPDDLPATRAAFEHAFATGEPLERQQRIHKADNGYRWHLVRHVPLRDARGEITRWFGAAVDIHESKLASEALRESEERLRQFGEASQDVLWIRDARTFQWEYLTPAFETIYGLDRDAALRGDNMAGWLELIVPEDRKHAEESLQRVRRGEWVTFEYRIRRPVDGAIRWLRNTDFPIHDGSGRVVRIGGIGHDITELKRTEGALAAAELRQRALLEGIPQLVWRAVDGGEWTWASPQWTDYTGQAEADSHGHGWLEPVHPDDRDAARKKWSHAMESGGFEVEYRLCNAATHTYRWFHTRASPVRDDSGAIVEWLGTSTDIDELRRLQDLQKTLLAELQHRVRNILAVIRSMMRRSSETQESLSDYVQHLDGRISAMARTQVLLTRSVDARVDLEELVRDELVAQAADESRISLKGPRVLLGPKAAEVVSLAVHELTTNAVKYGALSQASATLQVDWHVEDRANTPWLHFTWSEAGVAVAVSAPRREGFGSELITRRVPYELKGTGSLDVRPGGIFCELEFPLTDRASILQTDARTSGTVGDQ